MPKYTDEVRAQVVLDWQSGASKKAISRDHGIAESTVRLWVKDVPRAQIAPRAAPQKEARSIQELAGDLATESFNAQIAILRLAQDRTWLERQDASSLAILFGVNADKLYRLLPAFVPPPPDRGRGD